MFSKLYYIQSNLIACSFSALKLLIELQADIRRVKGLVPQGRPLWDLT